MAIKNVIANILEVKRQRILIYHFFIKILLENFEEKSAKIELFKVLNNKRC
jgi:hypothetical protein